MTAENHVESPGQVTCHLQELLTERGMTLAQLSVETGVSVANLAVLKNGRARAIRFSTLVSICEVLACQPADLLSVAPVR